MYLKRLITAAFGSCVSGSIMLGLDIDGRVCAVPT